MSFREVPVHEIREVLRLWLRGEGQRSIARLAAVDRKTVRRYVEAATGAGLERSAGEEALGDELISLVCGFPLVGTVLTSFDGDGLGRPMCHEIQSCS